MALLQAPFPGADPRRDDQRWCPECLRVFSPRQDAQLFCSPQHRDAWNNRWTTRGRTDMILAAVARYTRNGHRGGALFGQRASYAFDSHLARWRRDDALAGRMPLPAFIDLRYSLGFDPL